MSLLIILPRQYHMILFLRNITIYENTNISLSGYITHNIMKILIYSGINNF